ncbi:MAG: hypothetical protein ACQGVC_24545 [Myxococcota bacterium]
MNWEAIGAIGEVVGAAGVIVTLGFLAFQLRQNTRALRAESFSSALNMVHRPTSFIIEHADVADIQVRGYQSFAALDPVEQMRFHYLNVQRMHSIETMFQYRQAGAMDRPTYEAAHRLLERAATQPGFREWWRARSGGLFTDEFNAMVSRVIEANGG